MSSCSHFVISNSSFSWWAQYLSCNEDKIVYSPSKWYVDDRKVDIFQEKIILIKKQNMIIYICIQHIYIFTNIYASYIAFKIPICIYYREYIRIKYK